MDHLAFFEGNSHGDKTRSGNLEFANILIKTRKILELHVGDVGTKVKLSGDIDTAIKGLEGGPDITSSCRFSARDDGGDNGGNAALNDVLDLGIFLPPLAIGLEGGRTRIDSDSGHRNLGKWGEGVVGAFDETPEAFALQSAHDGLAPGGVNGDAVEGGNVVEF